MLFDSTLLFLHQGNVFNMTAGEAVSLATITASGSASSAINLGNARDLGVGSGQEVPKVAIQVATAFTSSQSTNTVNVQFQGSTNSTNSNFTTFMETGNLTTASFAAGSVIMFDVPRAPPSIGLPLYYRLNFILNSVQGTSSISTGAVIAGIVLEGDSFVQSGAQYSAGFSVA